MQVGTTKDQGLYNKPSATVHPGALAAGTLPQYNTIPNAYPHKKGTCRVPHLNYEKWQKGSIENLKS